MAGLAVHGSSHRDPLQVLREEVISHLEPREGRFFPDSTGMANSLAKLVFNHNSQRMTRHPARRLHSSSTLVKRPETRPLG